MGLRKVFKKFLIWTLVAVFLGSGFFAFLNFAPQKAQAAVNWSANSDDVTGHNFRADDKNYTNFRDEAAVGTQNYQINFTYKKSVNFWDFWDGYIYSLIPYGADDQTQKNFFANYENKKYSLFSIEGLSSFFLIVDVDANKTLGVFKQTTQTCTNKDTGKTQDCPWTYYRAYYGKLDTSWGPNKTYYLYKGTTKLIYNWDLQPESQTNFQFKYIDSVNKPSNGFRIDIKGVAACEPGKEYKADEYKNCYWPADGTFTGTLNDNGDNAPTISIPASTSTNPKPLVPSPFVFKLKYVIQTGTNDNLFYWVAADPHHPNLALAFYNCDTTGQIVTFVSSQWNAEWYRVEVGPAVAVDKDKLINIVLKKIYNNDKISTDGCPSADQLDSKGQLAKWGAQVNSSSQSGGETAETCGVGFLEGLTTKGALTKVLCTILRSMGDAAAWLIKNIFDTVFNAKILPKAQFETASVINPFSIQTAYADYPTLDQSSIKQALQDQDGWVLTSWKVILGLANVFVVIVLLFLAITNILHIQYDTYAIKKALPTLIFGIILANFSILITKMLVDATNAITATFMGDSAGEGVKNLVTAIIPPAGQSQGTFMATPTIGALLLALLFSFFALIAFAILGFLFYIRYIVILTLTIVAPLAFVLMAFPPTQGLFKQWWGWYAKFIFMKPISLFLVWLATLVLAKGGGVAGITVWALATFLVCAAIIVPFKMGGAVMGAWGKAGKWLASPATGAAKRAYEGKRDAWKERANLAAERYTPLGRWRTQHEETMTGLKAERESRKDELKEERRARLGGLEERREARRERQTKNLKRGKERRATQFYGTTDEGREMVNQEIEDTVVAGRLEIAKRNRMFEIYNTAGRGRELAGFEHDFANSELRLAKTKSDASETIAGEQLRNHRLIPRQLRNALENLEIAQERLAKSEEGSAEYVAAQHDITTQTAERDRWTRALRRAGVSQEQIDTYLPGNLNSSYVSRLQRTRNMAIINKSRYEDARDESTSHPPSELAHNVANGGGVGAFAWGVQDSHNFFTNGTTTTADAAQGLGAEMAALQTTLSDSRTMGAAFQGYAGVLRQHNQAYLERGVERTMEVSSEDAREKVRTAIRHQLHDDTAEITAENLSRVVLDTAGDLDIRGFVNNAVLQFQAADAHGGFAQRDDTGQIMRDNRGNVIVQTQGNSGLGRNIAAAVARSATP